MMEISEFAGGTVLLFGFGWDLQVSSVPLAHPHPFD